MHPPINDRYTTVPFIIVSLLLSNGDAASSVSSSRLTRNLSKTAAAIDSPPRDDKIIAMAVDTTFHHGGHGRNLNEAEGMEGDNIINGQQADNQVSNNEDEKFNPYESDLQNKNDQDITEETAAVANNHHPQANTNMSRNPHNSNNEGDSIAINNDGTVLDAVDALKELGVVLTEKNQEQDTSASLNGVMPQNNNEEEESMPEMPRMKSDSGNNADEGKVLNKQQLGEQQQQLPRQEDGGGGGGGEEGTSSLPKAHEIYQQQMKESVNTNDEGEADNNISQQPVPNTPSQIEQQGTTNENTLKEEQSMRDSDSSAAAANELQGEQKETILQLQQQQQGAKALSRREKLQQELKEARRNPKEYLRNQQEKKDKVVQSGLRGGDNPSSMGKPQQSEEEEVVSPIKETPKLPQMKVQEEKQRPLPLHHQAVLEKERAKNNEISSSANEIIPKPADVEIVEPKTLPPQQQQEPPPKQQQQPEEPPLPETSSSIQNMDNLPDAVKNTMLEMEKKDLEEGKEIGHHYKELKEQKKREAELRRQKLTVESGKAGNTFVRPPPQAFRIDDADAAQKFADYIAKQKKSIIRKEKMRHPIQAIVGGGGSVRTKDSSPMKNYKSQIDHGMKKSNQKMPDLRPEAQPKKGVGQKILGKIPIVKRVVKRTHGFETLNDAALSFTRGLQMGVFRNNNHALDNKRKAALLDWLDLLSISLPPELGLHELIDTLKSNMDLIAQSPSNLKAIIDKHPIPDSQYSQSCSRGVGSQGFFCGFWKLLHVASVGFSEQQGGLMLRELHPNIRVFSPKEAGSILREYMGLFFNCDKCSKRFIAQYDECKFQSCTRLTDKTVDAPAESWAEFPLWLWEVHNDVSRSRAERAADFHVKQNRKAEAKKWERYMGSVYPHLDQCLSCWTAEGTWDVNAVYRHLEKEYWTFGVVVDSKLETLLDHKEASTEGVSYGLGAYLGLGIVVLLTYVLKKYKIRVSGRHKKDDTSTSFPSRSGDGKIKYRDS